MEHEHCGSGEKETLREHMIRAHGCTEAMVRWVQFNHGFASGFECSVESMKRGLYLPDVVESLSEMLEPATAEGFRRGYRFGREVITNWARIGLLREMECQDSSAS